jgi:hypothetical protein
LYSQDCAGQAITKYNVIQDVQVSVFTNISTENGHTPCHKISLKILCSDYMTSLNVVVEWWEVTLEDSNFPWLQTCCGGDSGTVITAKKKLMAQSVWHIFYLVSPQLGAVVLDHKSNSAIGSHIVWNFFLIWSSLWSMTDHDILCGQCVTQDSGSEPLLWLPGAKRTPAVSVPKINQPSIYMVKLQNIKP